MTLLDMLKENYCWECKKVVETDNGNGYCLVCGSNIMVLPKSIIRKKLDERTNIGLSVGSCLGL